MAVTRLGWDVLPPSSKRLVNFRWITGKVRGGDAHTILEYLCQRFNDEVEKINPKHSWGYANRDVRGASGTISEHNAGTAIDLNAPKHPLGVQGTFTSAQVNAIGRILSDCGGVVRWGGNYPGRKDEMHFELQGGVKLLAQVAKQVSSDSGELSMSDVKTILNKLDAIDTRLRDHDGNSNQRAARTVTQLSKKLSKAPWLYKGKNERIDAYGYLRNTRREIAKILGALDGLLETVTDLDGVDYATVAQRVEDGVSAALKNLEVDATLNVDTGDDK